MKKTIYYAALDWGPSFKLAYEGPLVDLAIAEAKRRCIRPEGLRRITQHTTEVIFQKEPSNA